MRADRGKVDPGSRHFTAAVDEDGCESLGLQGPSVRVDRPKKYNLGVSVIAKDCVAIFTRIEVAQATGINFGFTCRKCPI